MTRMSSPDGSEVVTVETKVGESVLASLGWHTEGGSSRTRVSSTRSQERSAEPEESNEGSSSTPRRRGPGRPRKQSSEDTEGA